MNTTIWTKSAIIAIVERVAWTFVEAFVGAAGIDAIAIGALGWSGINWGPALGIGGAAALLAVVKTVGANLATKNGPSTTNHEIVVPPLPAPSAS